MVIASETVDDRSPKRTYAMLMKINTASSTPYQQYH